MPVILRVTLFALIAICLTAVAGLLVTLAVVLPLGVRFALVRVWYNTILMLCHRVMGIGYRVIHPENLPSTPCVILAKHQSAWETIALQQIFPPAVFVMKRSLLLIPFLGWGLAASKMISINREASKEALRQVARQGKERLDAGISVVIFPEGTRMPPGQTARFKPGGGLLATSSGALAVPVAHNAGEFWGRRFFDKKPGIITVSIGPAIDPTGKSASKVTQLAEQWVNAEMERLKAEN